MISNFIYCAVDLGEKKRGSGGVIGEGEREQKNILSSIC